VLAGFLPLLVLAVAGCSSSRGASVSIDPNIFLNAIIHPDGPIINGLYLTIFVSIIAQLIGVTLGIFAALGKMAKFPLFRIIANLYIWFFRGTPLLVQLAFLFYGIQSAHLLAWPTIELFGFTVTQEVLAGTIILGVNEGAYMAEIVRAGILSIDPGQNEAAKSLGMNYAQTMRRIVLPQAARVIMPPLGNEFNNMLKNTSLLMVLGTYELYNTFASKAGLAYQWFEFMGACCVWYLILTTIWGFAQAWIERRFSKGTTSSSGGPSWRDRIFGGRRSDAGEEIAVLGGH